ncbi:hypothetical protein GCM10010431_84260 [Streptomyces kunmingensis]
MRHLNGRVSPRPMGLRRSRMLQGRGELRDQPRRDPHPANSRTRQGPAPHQTRPRTRQDPAPGRAPYSEPGDESAPLARSTRTRTRTPRHPGPHLAYGQYQLLRT